ncbi:Ig-like domain-containing protein [Streptomyces sp. NPDC058891]|uniref:L,D-transpeptidase n=1 Tax=unclassified Streptomyces TaxID=2593676 RepID=UPI0036CC9154
MRHTRAVSAVAILSVTVLLLTGCGAGGPEATKASPSAGGASQPPVVLTLNASDGQKHVSVTRGGQVRVTGGSITRVSLTTADGAPVPGVPSADRRSWAPGSPLRHGTSYRLTATAADGHGHTVSRRIAFTTLAEGDRYLATHVPENGSTVGVGMPVSFTFDRPVRDRKAVESAFRITTGSGQTVVGHWFGDRRLDFRPEQYWEADSAVTVRIGLDGVEGAPGAYGEQEQTIHFHVGRRQVSTVDASAHTMRVERDGALLRTIPITAGAPGRTTWNGQMVISEKLRTTRMNGATVGFAGEYDIPDVPHAMRLSSSGTFVHGNYWGPDSVFGHENISHGCVGLNDIKGGGDQGQDAAWFYDHSLVGDVVVVKNSNDRTIAPDNGLNGWNMSWSQWRAGSAL